MALLAAMDDAMCVPQTLHEPAGTHSFGMHARRVGRAQKCVLQYKTAAYWTYLMTLFARPHAQQGDGGVQSHNHRLRHQQGGRSKAGIFFRP